MLRRLSASSPASTAVRRTAFRSPPTALPARSSCVATAMPTGTLAPLLMSSHLRVASRQYATSHNGSGDKGTAAGRNPLDSDQTDAFATQHFDLQDVDADRLTHFFWDRNEEGGSPYAMDETMLSELDEVLLMSEDNFENAWFVDPRDRRLLFNEYLYV